MSLFVALAVATAAIPSSPDLGVAEGRCREPETGPALLVEVRGLKDRRGRLKVEVFPANDTDFLADDNVLVMAGKTFRRVVAAVPAAGPAEVCVRVPGPGPYAVSLLHDRDGDGKFELSSDGIGFGTNPRLRRKPTAAEATVMAGSVPTRIAIVLNYRHGLFSFGPVKE